MVLVAGHNLDDGMAWGQRCRSLLALARPGLRRRCILAGVAADLFGFAPAIVTVGVLTAVSGFVVAVRMLETLRPA